MFVPFPLGKPGDLLMGLLTSAPAIQVAASSNPTLPTQERPPTMPGRSEMRALVKVIIHWHHSAASRCMEIALEQRSVSPYPLCFGCALWHVCDIRGGNTLMGGSGLSLEPIDGLYLELGHSLSQNYFPSLIFFNWRCQGLF